MLSAQGRPADSNAGHSNLFMNKIYIFGNALLEFDNLPIKLMPKLQNEFPQIRFIHADPNENLNPENGELFIIDTVILQEGRPTSSLDVGRPKNEIIVFDDLDKIELSPSVSMHDLDLGFTLKLLKKIGKLNKVIIIGVPTGTNEDEAFEKINFQIKKHLPNI